MRNSTDAKQLRTFGLLVGGILCAIALWPVIGSQNPRWWALVPGALLVFVALIAPGFLGPVQRVWMRAADALGWVNTRILLGVVFYGLITPMGCVMRLLGNDPLQRRYEPGIDSYRVVKRPRPGAHMTRQF